MIFQVCPYSTCKYIADAGLDDRITTKAGDYNNDSLGAGYDLIFVSSIIHSLSCEATQILLNKCASALREKGQIIIRDFFMNENKSGPLFSALFALNMLVATDQGNTYTIEEVTNWLNKSGFTDIQVLDPPEANARLIAGRRG